MENYEKHRELLNLPAWVFPVALLCFGYYPEGERPAPRPRFERKYIAFAEQYQRFNPENLMRCWRVGPQLLLRLTPTGHKTLVNGCMPGKRGHSFRRRWPGRCVKPLKTGEGSRFPGLIPRMKSGGCLKRLRAFALEQTVGK